MPNFLAAVRVEYLSIQLSVIADRLAMCQDFSREFARKVGISQSQLSRYEKGVSEIGGEALLRISKKFARSIEWLLTGKES